MKWIHANQFLDKKDAEITELKRPNSELLTQIDNLKTDLAKLAPLEADNAFLKQQLETLKKDPLAEKNAWLTVELSKREDEIKRLKADNEQKENAIKTYMYQQGDSR